MESLAHDWWYGYHFLFHQRHAIWRGSMNSACGMGSLKCDGWVAINRSTINKAPPQSEVQLPVSLQSANMVPKPACALCHFNFTRKSDLSQHMNSKHCQDGVKHECADCRKTFNRKDNLKQHQSICQTIRFQCPRCHRILQDIASLIKHMGLCPVPTCTCQGQFVELNCQNTRKPIPKNARLIPPQTPKWRRNVDETMEIFIVTCV